jgi:CRISPR-associated protein Csm4
LKVYEITIKPVTGFGTPLKGDTIFGHFCWQIAYDPKLAEEPLEELLSDYQTNPFAVFSSVFPKFVEEGNYCYALKTPNLPMEELFNFSGDKKDKIKERKEIKAKKWMLLKEGQKLSSLKELNYVNDKELLSMANTNLSDEMRKQVRKAGSKSFIAALSQYHNKINRLVNTTGEEGFAPFAVEQQIFYPETELALFVGIDETVLSIEQVREGLERIGTSGFGKDASTGLGRFELGEDNEMDLPEMGSPSPNACYTLSPCVPEKETYKEMFFAPFTRFGRHGDVLAKSKNPFKNPVIMADEGAIFIPKTQDIFNKPYIGTAVRNVSLSEPNAVTQGYSLYIPVRVEV